MNAAMKKTILLVEDESIIALMETQTIKRFGYEILVAGTGEEAVEIATGDREIDLVLMDIDLGRGIDGPEAAKRILAARMLPIVFLTSHMEKEYVSSVKRITRYGYVVKNSSDFVLHSSIEMAFELFDAHEKLRLERDALRESKETAERYLNAAAALVISLDERGDIALVNDSGCKILGYAREELLGRNWFDACVRGDARARLREGFLKAIRGEAEIVPVDEYEIAAKDGAERTIFWRHTLCADKDGRNRGVLSSGEDITERRQAQLALLKSEERCREIIERTIDYIYTVYYENGAIVKTVHNPACVAVTGYSAREFNDDPYLWLKMIVPEDRDIVEDQTRRLRYETAPEAIEHRIRRKDGTLRWIRSTPVLHFDSSGALVSRDGIIVDITERKLAEERVKNLLHEKELLLHEVHHRVKNNMASLASLLSLQADASSEAIVANALGDARGRVESMQVLYDKLYQRGNCRYILAKEYFDDLVSYIAAALCPAANVSLVTRVDDVMLAADYFFPLGILANELITNALKHAFPQGRGGSIRIDFHSSADCECILQVADDGVGLPSVGGARRPKGMGLGLINAMAEQLHGKVEIIRGGGTQYKITFAAKNAVRVGGD
jgi:two-component system, sensor histidine kinase PdtaS